MRTYDVGRPGVGSSATSCECALASNKAVSGNVLLLLESSATEAEDSRRERVPLDLRDDDGLRLSAGTGYKAGDGRGAAGGKAAVGGDAVDDETAVVGEVGVAWVRVGRVELHDSKGRE